MSSQSAIEASTETTPLLRKLSPTAEPSIQKPALLTPRLASTEDGNDAETTLAKSQIFFLCVARVVEPIAYFGIFPFINQMLWETGEMEKKDVGFYSGLIESMFSFTQMCLMIFWGIAADRIGRKPVLVFSLGGVAIATGVFGLSRTVWQMILLRCCAGIFGGSIVTLRTMISENSTPKTQARAFSFFAFSGNLGVFIGPVIGGTLSNPTKQYPINKIFGGVEFFKDYPYALPTFVTGVIGVFAACLCAVFIKETLKRKVNGGEATVAPMTTSEVIRAPGVAIAIFIYAYVMLLGLAYTAVMPVFYFTPVNLGGFGFSPPQISFFIAMVGVSQAFWLLVVFPPLQLRFGTVGVMRGCLAVWPFLFAFGPICNMLLKRGFTTAFWITAPASQVIGCGVAMAFTCVQLLLNSAAPSAPSSSPSSSAQQATANLGKLNAIALTLISGTRSIVPGLFTSLFATGVRTQWLGGNLVWVVLILLAVVAFTIVNWGIDDVDGEGSKKVKEITIGDGNGINRGEALRTGEITNNRSSAEQSALAGGKVI